MISASDLGTGGYYFWAVLSAAQENTEEKSNGNDDLFQWWNSKLDGTQFETQSYPFSTVKNQQILDKLAKIECLPKDPISHLYVTAGPNDLPDSGLQIFWPSFS